MNITPLEIDTSNKLVTITINRPEARNSLSPELIQRLTHAFDGLRNNPSERCVLLTAAGSEAFCSGADLTHVIDNPNPDARRAFFDSIAQLIESMIGCPIPIVCAVHGFALAGGCGLVASSDIVLAADDAVFGLPETSIGLAPMVVMGPLSRVMQPRSLATMALTGTRLTAQEALNAGLITRIVPKQDLLSEARKVCDSIIHQGPGAIRATKAALRDLQASHLASVIHELADRSALISLEGEAHEGLRAFREKRKPDWRT